MPDDPRATITSPATDADILATWEVMHELRPHLSREGYVERVRALMASDGFRLAAVVAGSRVQAVAGYRVVSLLHCGRALVVDDLVTSERTRSAGHGKRLLDWLKCTARDEGCAELSLVSRVTRERAHRFYFREGLGIERFEFRIAL
jgi:ribosomal protein S18 acetylase RimI-like enzyme